MTPYSLYIPARMASTRLPGKPMKLIGGKPMIRWVIESAMRSDAKHITVVTDSDVICDFAQKLGVRFFRDRASFKNGTEAISAAISSLEDDSEIIVNLQGDAPFVPHRDINECVRILEEHPECGASTLYFEATGPEWARSSAVKCIILSGKLIYCSRLPIPHGTLTFHIHIGLYAFRRETIRAYGYLPPNAVEEYEDLEQLRILDRNIVCGRSLAPAQRHISVDTKLDLIEAKDYAHELAIWGDPFEI